MYLLDNEAEVGDLTWCCGIASTYGTVPWCTYGTLKDEDGKLIQQSDTEEWGTRDCNNVVGGPYKTKCPGKTIKGNE